MLANLDALRATALPVSGALATQNLDGCYLHNGESKAYITGLIDGDLTTYQQSQAYEVGSVRSNVRVIAERDVTNADTSTRKEVDVRYDITYKDGTSDIDAFQTMVTGSTSGLCATSSNSTTMRLVGNQRKVLVTLQARNIDTSIASLATGADVSESVRRELRFIVRDPAKVATYAVVTGPGPAAADGTPFSWKMISPRILRDDPLLVNKLGNANWRDIDGFRVCSQTTQTVTVATLADCVNPGVQPFDTWGRTMTPKTSTDTAAITAADNAFTAQGWVAGGTYTFAVYADDGWKTVNGQAGKTPIGTYTTVLTRLPYTFAQMAAASSKYPDWTSSSLTSAQVAAAFTGTGGTLTLSGFNVKVPTGGAPMALADMYVFGQGPNTGAAANGWPRTREIDLYYPGSSATSATLILKGKNAATLRKTFAEIALEYTDRNGGLLLYLVDYQ